LVEESRLNAIAKVEDESRGGEEMTGGNRGW
jgi:hypothetical protein